MLDRNKAERIAVVLLRIVAGLMFVCVGGMKLFGWFGGMPGGMTLSLFSEIGLAGILEVFGGAAIVLGAFTRPVAFILSGEMAVAYFQGHQPHGLLPIQNHGEQAVLYCFIFLFFAAHGAGDFSVDALIGRRRGANP